MLSIFSKIYNYFNLLSLDVAIGAAVLCGSLNYFINDNWNWNFAISLGLAVWIIYTFDHLLDAQKSKKEPNIPRHKFHKKNKKTIQVFQVVAIIIGGISVFELPQLTIYYGVGLLSIVVGYFVVVFFFRSFYLKEIIVAVVYASGVFLGPISIFNSPINFEIANYFIQLLAIALVNLTLFSWIEYDLDNQDGHASIATKLGKRKTSIFIMALLICLFSWQVFMLIFYAFQTFQILFLMMTVFLSIIYFRTDYLNGNYRYRWLGDAIFFIPGIELLF